MDELLVEIKTENEDDDFFEEADLNHSYLQGFPKCPKTEAGDNFDHETVIIKKKDVENEYLNERFSTQLDHNFRISIKSEEDGEHEDAYIKEETDGDVCIEDHKLNWEPTTKQEILSEEDNSSNCGSERKQLNFACSYCTYVTSDFSDLAEHETIHKDSVGSLLFFCTHCNYRTNQKSHLKRHDLTHRAITELAFYKCHICEKKYKQKCTLRRHVQETHQAEKLSKENGERLYKCNHCTYQTNRKGLLMTHFDKHKNTGDINNLYVCDICSFASKYRRNLRVHLEVHKETKELNWYECKTCNFKTRMRRCLTRHFLSKKHLLTTGKINEYVPRNKKMD